MGKNTVTHTKVRRALCNNDSDTSDPENLHGSDSDDHPWLDEVTDKLVSPYSTPMKPRPLSQRKAAPQLEETAFVKTGRKLASTVKRVTPSSFRDSSLSEFTPTLPRLRIPASAPTSAPARKGAAPLKNKVYYISSEEEDDADTETETDSDSLFDRAGPSRQTTMSSIASSPSPLKNTSQTRLEDESLRTNTRWPTTRSVSPASDDPFIDIRSRDSTFSPAPSPPNTVSRDSTFSPASSPSPSTSPPSSSPIPASIPNSPSDSSDDVPVNTRPDFGSSPLTAIFGDKIHLYPKIIAHDAETQKLFDDPKGPVPWGTQYELARGVPKEWTWEQVREKLLQGKFRGKSDGEVLHLVRSIMKDETSPKWCSNDIGMEFDREQLAILESCERGLGLQGEFQGVDKWFGGQIQQIATLKKNPKKEHYLHLEPLEMRRSTRFTRWLGSRRVIQVRVPDDLRNEANMTGVLNFLRQKFILNGRVYVATPPKESSVYLVEIKEEYERNAMSLIGDQHRKSLGEVLEWHNPIGLNSRQPITKYAARAALALSNTLPALLFSVENIHFFEDIVAKDFKGTKPPAYKVLTDGCGFINEAGLRSIATELNLPSRPTAVQGRIAGSKGLWTIHPTNNSQVPQIWIRDSQQKIMYPNFVRQKITYPNSESIIGHYLSLDRAHRIFDLCLSALPSLSSMGPSISLNQQSVLNMWANDVPTSVFEELMEKGLQDIIDPLTDWDGEFAMARLWDTVNRVGKVSYARTLQLAAVKARAIGVAGRNYGKEESGDSRQTDESSHVSTSSGRNEVSGNPLSLHETAIEMIQAGFHPEKDVLLWSVLKNILETAVENAIKKCSIPLPEGSSTHAFVIPDPLGVLEEDEVYYRSSTPMKNMETQTLYHTVIGTVLIGRYPLRVRSDIQKVKAVDKPELAPWSDVIIVPTKPSMQLIVGLVSLMSKCSGGDHDGDELFLIWLKTLVDLFNPSSLVLPPDDLGSNFECDVKSVEAVMSELGEASRPVAQKTFIRTLLGGLTDSSVGLYDAYHDKAVRYCGYESKEATRLAFLFNDLLDAPKTGKVLRTDIRKADNAQSKGFERELSKATNSGLGKPFVFDVLEAFGKKLMETNMQAFSQMQTSFHDVLLQPYRNAQKLCQIRSLSADAAESVPKDLADIVARGLQAARASDLRLIEAHVNQVFREFGAKYGAQKEARTYMLEEDNKKKKKKKSSPDIMLPISLEYAKDIRGLVGAFPNVEHIKASYAYTKGQGNFAKSVAFRTLCQIMVNATDGGGAPCSRLLDQVKSISGKAVRLFQ